MYLLLFVMFGWPIIAVFLIVWNILSSRSPQVFEQRNLGKLLFYQKKISELSSEAKNHKTDIRRALNCFQEITNLYSELHAFCSKSAGGREWFRNTCSLPVSQTKEGIADYTKLLSELQTFHADFFPTVSLDNEIQTDWAIIPCDHDSYEQLTRQKRSIRTLPIYIDHGVLDAFFLSNDMNFVYSVTLFSCTCPDHNKRGLPCKHMYRLFYELTVGTEYTMGINVTDLEGKTEFLKLSNVDKVSYINTIRSLHGRKNRPLTTRKLPYIVKALQTGLLLQSDFVDYASLLNARTKDEIIISLRDFGITDCYPSWTKVRLIDYVTEKLRHYLVEEYKDFTAVTIPPVLEPWCNGFCSVIESRFIGDTAFLEEWNRRFDKFL